MSFWGFFTALLRPLTGEGIGETVERSYNFGIPLCLWYFYFSTKKITGILRPVQQRGPFDLHAKQLCILMHILKCVMAGMLVGHGALGTFRPRRAPHGHTCRPSDARGRGRPPARRPTLTCGPAGGRAPPSVRQSCVPGRAHRRMPCGSGCPRRRGSPPPHALPG